MVTRSGEPREGERAATRVGALLESAQALLPALQGMLAQAREQLSDEPGQNEQSQLAALRAENDQLREAIDRRGVIEQAKGVLMVREGVDSDAAFQLLVDRSRRERRRVREIAAEVVASIPAQAAPEIGRA